MRSFFSLLSVVLLAVGVWVAIPVAAGAADRAVVHVIDNAYDDGDSDPNTTYVTAGDVVEWRWSDANENPHTVTAFDGSFDSDPGCGSLDDPCGAAQRQPYTVTFNESGEYRYTCKVHGLEMIGTIVVGERDAPSDSPSEPDESPLPTDTGAPSAEPSDEPSPSESPSASGSPSPAPTKAKRSPRPGPGSPSPSDGATGTQDGQDGGSGSGAPPRQSSSSSIYRPRAYYPGGARQTFEPRSGASGGGPPAAVASPSFEPFPSPAPLSDEAAKQELAIEVPVNGSAPPLLVGLAIGSVTVSAGALAKFVLFGPSWR